MEAIAEQIAVKGHAHAKEIAEKLHVKMPSVTGALRSLTAMGYIIYDAHYPVQLTREGEKAAKQVVRRHEILEEFFSKILGLPLEKASETACRLEHVVDESTIRRFLLFSEAIRNRADARDLQTYLTEAISFCDRAGDSKRCVLSELSSGETARVAVFGRNLKHPEKTGLAIGETFVLSGVSLDRSFFRVLTGDRVLEIPRETAENLWVEIVRAERVVEHPGRP